MSEVNKRENLEKLATYLESLPEDYNQFDMATYISAREYTAERYALHNGGVPCGTVACAVGHGPSAGILVPANFIDEWGIDWTSYSYEMFISTKDEWVWCFSSWWWGTDNTSQGAAARIRYFLEHGVPECLDSHDIDYHLKTLYEPYLKKRV